HRKQAGSARRVHDSRAGGRTPTVRSSRGQPLPTPSWCFPLPEFLRLSGAPFVAMTRVADGSGRVVAGFDAVVLAAVPTEPEPGGAELGIVGAIDCGGRTGMLSGASGPASSSGSTTAATPTIPADSAAAMVPRRRRPAGR